MKRYEYVPVDMKVGLLNSKMKTHHKVIDEYAAKGYRYVGWFPISTSNLLSGVIERVELIFEYD